MIDINITADGTITLYECDPAKNTACKHESVFAGIRGSAKESNCTGIVNGHRGKSTTML